MKYEIYCTQIVRYNQLSGCYSPHAVLLYSDVTVA